MYNITVYYVSNIYFCRIKERQRQMEEEKERLVKEKQERDRFLQEKLRMEALEKNKKKW